jgi:hypothetical protein
LIGRMILQNLFISICCLAVDLIVIPKPQSQVDQFCGFLA